MDATPPPDLPDPAVPNPAANSDTVSSKTGGSRIRSMPTPVRQSARLPGTYAANYGDEDMNWRRAVVFLWLFFAVAAGLEIVSVVCILLAEVGGSQGGTWLYSVSGSEAKDVRFVVVSPAAGGYLRVLGCLLAFVGIWIGWGWTRWLLAAIDALSGIWLTVHSLRTYFVLRSTPVSELFDAPPAISVLILLALGLAYVATAVYLVFSVDLVDFLRHRREEGRKIVLLPVAALAAAYLGILLTLGLPYRWWAESRYAEIQPFGEKVVRDMAARWDPASLDEVGTASLEQHWTPDFKQRAFASLAAFGPLENPGEASIRPYRAVRKSTDGDFTVRYHYELRRARFAHGTADMEVIMVKHLSGPWRVENLEMNDVRFDPKPTPALPPDPSARSATPTTAAEIPSGSVSAAKPE